VIQGILTGIGFLGAGVIIRTDHHARIRGLTSAACTWLTACVGVICGAGQWRIAAVALVITFAVLIAGGRTERALHHLIGGKDDDKPPKLAETDRPPPEPD
jgi:putative Mg2+ transporter-C (MgtC) family protein